MAATVEQLEERVAFLERELRRTIVIIDHLEARTDTRLARIDQHLEQQDAAQHEASQQVKIGFESVDKRFEQQAATQHAFALGVNQRFEHVYGALADINANTVEIRNILADIVKRIK